MAKHDLITIRLPEHLKKETLQKEAKQFNITFNKYVVDILKCRGKIPVEKNHYFSF